jgi:hypothetical protein
MMSLNHVAIWIDHDEAHIIHFKFATLENELVRAYSYRPHIHIKSRRTGSTLTGAAYFEEIVQAAQNSIEILLIGPGVEKYELMKYITAQHRFVAERIVGVVTAEQPSDAELLTFARSYFEKIDQMRVDPIQALRQSRV